MERNSFLTIEHSSIEPYFVTHFGKVYRADALEMLRGLPDECVDLFVTSPPYDGQPKYNDQQTYDRAWYKESFLDITKEMLRVLKPTGNFVLNYRSRRYNKERGTIQYELVFWLREQGWLFVEDFIWGKLNPPPGKFNQCLKDGVEYCFQFAKDRAFSFYPEQSLIKSRLTDEEREYRNRLNTQNRPNRQSRPSGHGASEANARPDLVRPSTLLLENIANYSNCTWFKRARDMGLHPASFPEEVPDFFIKLMTKAGEVICDPFAGSGTVGASATKLGRRFILGEVQQHYCEITKLRLGELSQMPLMSEEGIILDSVVA